MEQKRAGGATARQGGTRFDEIEALAAVCALTAGLFKRRMGEEEAERLCAIRAEDDDFVLDQPLCRKGLLMMQDFLEGDRAESLARASDDFHDLFVGPHKLVAPPWSSVYLDEGGTLFGPTALRVRDAFAAEGYEIPEGAAEPADHIAYELQFLANVQGQAVDAWRAGDEERAFEALRVARDFMERFLQPWMGTLCERMSTGAATEFYRGLSAFAKGLAELERAALCEIERGDGA